MTAAIAALLPLAGAGAAPSTDGWTATRSGPAGDEAGCVVARAREHIQKDKQAAVLIDVRNDCKVAMKATALGTVVTNGFTSMEGSLPVQLAPNATGQLMVVYTIREGRRFGGYLVTSWQADSSVVPQVAGCRNGSGSADRCPVTAVQQSPGNGPGAAPAIVAKTLKPGQPSVVEMASALGQARFYQENFEFAQPNAEGWYRRSDAWVAYRLSRVDGCEQAGSKRWRCSYRVGYYITGPVTRQPRNSHAKLISEESERELFERRADGTWHMPEVLAAAKDDKENRFKWTFGDIGADGGGGGGGEARSCKWVCTPNPNGVGSVCGCQ